MRNAGRIFARNLHPWQEIEKKRRATWGGEANALERPLDAETPSHHQHWLGPMLPTRKRRALPRSRRAFTMSVFCPSSPLGRPPHAQTGRRPFAAGCTWRRCGVRSIPANCATRSPGSIAGTKPAAATRAAGTFRSESGAIFWEKVGRCVAATRGSASIEVIPQDVFVVVIDIVVPVHI